ncbi:MAG: tetratricopeptide repeat protein, partial [Halieaceae bacterium]|nr:tetratricopeptide repeat protein [Halieaceae bacterium]
MEDQYVLSHTGKGILKPECLSTGLIVTALITLVGCATTSTHSDGAVSAGQVSTASSEKEASALVQSARALQEEGSNVVLAYELYLRAAELGSAEAAYQLGKYHYEGLIGTKSLEEALRWYTRAAEQGHSGAQWWLGWMYQEGEGTVVDPETSVKWYRAAAEQGDSGAQMW